MSDMRALYDILLVAAEKGPDELTPQEQDELDIAFHESGAAGEPDHRGDPYAWAEAVIARQGRRDPAYPGEDTEPHDHIPPHMRPEA